MSTGYVDGHVRRGHTFTFFTIFALAVVELGLAAFLTQRFHRRGGAFSHQESVRVHYVLFAAVWTVLVSLLYTVAFRARPTGSALTGTHSHLFALFLTWAFWLAAAALLTNLFGGGLSCGAGRGSARFGGIPYCKRLSTLEGVAWIEFILLTFALIAVGVRGHAAGRRGAGFGGALVGGAAAPGHDEKRGAGAARGDVGAGGAGAEAAPGAGNAAAV